MSRTLTEDLVELHADYVYFVNTAVAEDDVALAEELAGRYEDDAIKMIVERQGSADLLPFRRPASPPAASATSSLRRIVGRLRPRRAA